MNSNECSVVCYKLDTRTKRDSSAIPVDFSGYASILELTSDLFGDLKHRKNKVEELFKNETEKQILEIVGSSENYMAALLEILKIEGAGAVAVDMQNRLYTSGLHNKMETRIGAFAKIKLK